MLDSTKNTGTVWKVRQYRVIAPYGKFFVWYQGHDK